MNTLIIMAILLFLLMTIFGGEKGARSFGALFFNFAVFLLAILFMLDASTDPLIITLIACVVISSFNLFYINGINTKTIAAFFSTILTILAIALPIIALTKSAMIPAFSGEELPELTAFSLYIGVDFVKVGVSVVILSTIGALTDSAISVSSPMQEVLKNNSSISKKELFKTGMSIGVDQLGTNTNTLFFAFFGSYLGLLIWFKELSYSVGEIINSSIFSAEMLIILFAGIGIALIIPVTAWLTTYLLMKKR